MEVHHHPDLHHKKKNFKEYTNFTEFYGEGTENRREENSVKLSESLWFSV